MLSPSDFEFHNNIQTKNGLKILDFEYFDWNDAFQLTCDFILHPSMAFAERQKNFMKNHSFQNRLNLV